MINVVIIDDGLYEDGKIKISESYIYRFGRFIKVKNNKGVIYTHGTICANIINAPNTIFTSVKIIDNGHPVSIEILKTAIEFSCKLSPDVIHISLGTFSWNAYILRNVTNNIDKETFIVASADAYGKLTYPACLNNVIGVSHSDYLYENDYVTVLPNITGINVYTSAPKCFFDGRNNKVIIPKTSSYAAAAVTHKLCLWLQNGGERNIDNFLYSLDNRYTADIYSHTLEDRILVVVYKGKKPKIEKHLIVFNFSNILFYDASNGFSIIQIHEKKLCLAFDKSITSIKNDFKIEELINNNDVVLMATDNICKYVTNLIPQKTIRIWHNPSHYSIYNRFNINIMNEEKKLIRFNGMRPFLKYAKQSDEFFPITTNPLNEIYGMIYTDDKNVENLARKLKQNIIACIN